MSDEKGNVSAFPPRRGGKAGAISTAQNEPAKVGEYIGGFDRYPCGECIHWKKAPQFGLNVGVCMRFPPQAMMVQGPGGQPAQALMRPVLPDTHEGCDEHDDETFFEDGDGTPGEDPARAGIIAAG